VGENKGQVGAGKGHSRRSEFSGQVPHRLTVQAHPQGLPFQIGWGQNRAARVRTRPPSLWQVSRSKSNKWRSMNLCDSGGALAAIATAETGSPPGALKFQQDG